MKYKNHQDVKGDSWKRINKKELVKGKFSWQAGYWAFSYFYFKIDEVLRYINNQKQHHKKITFGEEYIEFLEQFHVPWDDRFILKDIE